MSRRKAHDQECQRGVCEFYRGCVPVSAIGEKIVALRRGINLLFGLLDGKIKVHWDRVSSYSVV